MTDLWNDPETVREFRERSVDVRLDRMMEAYSDPPSITVLDLGCAGGRNAEPLAARGFDLWAVDAASAMVDATRERLARIFGTKRAQERVLVKAMDDLSFLDDGSVDLVVALGIYQQARSLEEWTSALAETARVMRRGARCLVANFGPRTGPIERVPELVAAPFVYKEARFGAWCLPTAEQLDASFAGHGLHPTVPTETVERELEGKRRQTVNALLMKS